MKSILAVFTILIALYIASCAGKTVEAVDTPDRLEFIDMPTELQVGLPPLPRGHETSGTVVTERNGANYSAKSGNAIENGSRLDLLSGSNSDSWAYWQFEPEARVVTALELIMDIDAGNEYYVAVSDYGLGRWKFAGPFTSGRVFRADSFDFASPAGNFYAMVLTFGGNKTTVAAVNVTTADNWQSVDIRPDLGPSNNSEARVIVLDGLPAVIFLDNATNSYRILRSSTQLGEAAADWTESLFLDTAVVTPYYLDAAVINGLPAITFKDVGMHNVNYFRQGMSESIAITGDLSPAGARNSLLEVQGRPAVAYYHAADGNMGDLMYVRSTTPGGQSVSDWDNKVIAMEENNWGDYPDMQLVGGNPAIVFRDVSFGNLMYAWCDDPTGETAEAWDRQTLHLSTGSIRYPSLAIVDGHPAVAYQDWDDNPQLFFTRARVPSPAGEFEDWPPTSPNQSLLIDNTKDTGLSTSMAAVNGRPFIAYIHDDSTANQLRYAVPNTVDGADGTWHRGLVLDEVGNQTQLCSALELHGRIVVCYTDYSSGDGNKSIRWCWRDSGDLQ